MKLRAKATGMCGETGCARNQKKRKFLPPHGREELRRVGVQGGGEWRTEGRSSAISGGNLLSSFVALQCDFPIHHIPPCLEVVASAILIFQVISVLPDVIAKDDVVTFAERAILICG